jgi:hypothetical protein
MTLWSCRPAIIRGPCAIPWRHIRSVVRSLSLFLSLSLSNPPSLPASFQLTSFLRLASSLQQSSAAPSAVTIGVRVNGLRPWAFTLSTFCSSSSHRASTQCPQVIPPNSAYSRNCNRRTVTITASVPTLNRDYSRNCNRRTVTVTASVPTVTPNSCYSHVGTSPHDLCRGWHLPAPT